MKLRIDSINRLISQDFGGNLAVFCRALGLSYTTVWRTLTGRSSGKVRFIPALYSYCKQSDRNIALYLE